MGWSRNRFSSGQAGGAALFSGGSKGLSRPVANHPVYFVDQPRQVVEQADGLAEAIKRLPEMFAVERARLEGQCVAAIMYRPRTFV
jgi:hypothetical protein